ncbi:6749_t:CDS:1, partial [Diversispora eburnea]
LRLMQNPVPALVENSPIQNPDENLTPAQNLTPTPEGNLISFDENSSTLQPREPSAPAVDLLTDDISI